MKKSVFLIVSLFGFMASSAVQAQAIPNLSLSDRQRISRDLSPTNSQDFFLQGQAQFEREVRLLERRFTEQKEPPLKIDPALQNPENPRSMQNEATVVRPSRSVQTRSPDFQWHP